MNKFLLLLFIAIISVGIMAGAYGKPITIETPYLIGDEVRISIQFSSDPKDKFNGIVIIRAICIDANQIFYVIEGKESKAVVPISLQDLQKYEIKEVEKL